MVASDGTAFRCTGKAGAARRAGARCSAEFVVSARGVEGGGIYALAHLLRDGAPLMLDLAPGRDETELARRLARPRGAASLANHLRKAIGLSPVKLALLRDSPPSPSPTPPAPQGPSRRCRLPLEGPRPIDEAISTAGGVERDALDADLMLCARPGVFCAGEMLDWDAPTGGYLLTACLATGRHAGRAAARWPARR